MAHTHKFEEAETGLAIDIGKGLHVHRLGRETTSPASEGPGHTHTLGDKVSGGPLEKEVNEDLAKEIKK